MRSTPVLKWFEGGRQWGPLSLLEQPPLYYDLGIRLRHGELPFKSGEETKVTGMVFTLILPMDLNSWNLKVRHGRLPPLLYILTNMLENHSPQPVNGRPDQNTAAATALPQRLRLDHPPTPPSFDSDSEHTPGRQRSLISNAASPVSPNSTTGSQAHTFDTNFTSASEPDLLDAIMEGQVFPQGSWGLMETAVMVGNNSITATLMENPTHEYNHLATPLDLTTDFVPHSHLNHHQMAPNGFCSQCFDDALSAAADH